MIISFMKYSGIFFFLQKFVLKRNTILFEIVFLKVSVSKNLI